MAKVSVVMAVYNGERYFKEALDSLFAQTMADFDCIVVDDASGDRTSEILGSCGDSRLRVIRNTENMGLTPSLNNGLALATGDYVARFDADDICYPERLAKQVAYLEAYPEVGLLGTAYRRMGENGSVMGGVLRKPTSDSEIRWTALLENPFAHPTVMIRRSILVENGLVYDTSFETTQDYDLWVRLLAHCQGANLEEPLLKYRVHSGAVSWRRREAQQNNSLRIAAKAIRSLLGRNQVDEETVFGLQQVLFGQHRLFPPETLERVAFARAYLSMFNDFTGEKSGALTRQVAVRLTHLVLLPPLQKGWFAILKEAMKLHPLVLLAFSAHMANIMVRELGRKALYRGKGA